VAFRLTLWYAVIFTASSLAAFLLFYLLLLSNIHARTDRALRDKVQEFFRLMHAQGLRAVEAEMVREASASGTGTIFFRILSSNGEELASTDFSGWGSIGVGQTALKRVAYGRPVFQTIMGPERRYKVRTVYAMLEGGKILQMGQSLKDDERLLEDFREIFGTSMAVVMALAALVGWLMARRALAGVEKVTQTAIHISKGDLDSRVPIIGRGDEIDRLAATFNAMLERLQALIKGMREMSDNIAHDLRSPIARIRGIAEATLTTSDANADCMAMAANIIEECDRLLEMINTMLDISEAEMGMAKLAVSPVDMADVVREACELFQPVAEDKDIHLTSQLSGKMYVHGDLQKLQRIVANLVDNAVKYSSPGGTVTVSVGGDDRQVTISVKDGGMGIAAHDLPHVFERFYRGDASRSQAGAGLGLSLARALARAHGGDITVASLPGQGSTFTVTLPRSG
jgi:heavy metal sensor kinase